MPITYISAQFTAKMSSTIQSLIMHVCTICRGFHKQTGERVYACLGEGRGLLNSALIC